MIIGQDKIDTITRDYNILFNTTLKAKEEISISSLATVVKSTSDATNYPALVGVPKMRKWVDEAKIQSIIGNVYTVQNEEFEATVGVPLKAIEDDNMGMYDAKIKEMGVNARSYPLELLDELLNKAFSENDYTGKPFISLNKPFIPGVTKGLKNPTFSNKGTKTLTADALEEALGQFKTIKDPYGNTIFSGSIIKPTLIVPPALEFVARRLVEKDENNGNALYGAAKVLVRPGIVNSKAWFLADMDSAVKPFLFQERRAVTFFYSQPNLSGGYASEDFIRTHQILFQSTARGAAAYGASSRIWGSDGSTAG